MIDRKFMKGNKINEKAVIKKKNLGQMIVDGVIRKSHVFISGARGRIADQSEGIGSVLLANQVRFMTCNT